MVTPTMMPAVAQVAAMLSTPVVPSARARAPASAAYQRRVAAQIATAIASMVAQNTESTGEKPEQHEHDDGDQRAEVEPVAPRDAPQRALLDQQLAAAAVLGGIQLHHHQDGEVVEDGRDRGHPDDVEVGDLEELGDQEGGRAEHRRRDDGAETAGRQQAAGGVLS